MLTSINVQHGKVSIVPIFADCGHLAFSLPLAIGPYSQAFDSGPRETADSNRCVESPVVHR